MAKFLKSAGGTVLMLFGIYLLILQSWRSFDSVQPGPGPDSNVTGSEMIGELAFRPFRDAMEDPSGAGAVLWLGISAFVVGSILASLAATGAKAGAAAAKEAAGQRPSGRKLSVVIADLKDADPEVRVRAAQELAAVGHVAAAPALIGALRDEEGKVRVGAARALAACTGIPFEFDPRASKAERTVVVRRWEAWWRNNQAKIRNAVKQAAERGVMPDREAIARLPLSPAGAGAPGAGRVGIDAGETEYTASGARSKVDDSVTEDIAPADDDEDKTPPQPIRAPDFSA